MTLLREDRVEGFPGDDGTPINGAYAPNTRLQVASTQLFLAFARGCCAIPPSAGAVF